MSKRKTNKAKGSTASARTALTVTTENFGDLLVQGAREAVAVARGETEPARVRMVTAREATAPPPPLFTGTMIRQLRRRLHLSQEVFAQVIYSTPSAVRSWEQDQRSPDGPTRRLLEIASEQPATVMAKLVPSTEGVGIQRDCSTVLRSSDRFRRVNRHSKHRTRSRQSTAKARA